MLFDAAKIGIIFHSRNFFGKFFCEVREKCVILQPYINSKTITKNNMCQTALISNSIARLSKRSFAHQLNALQPVPTEDKRALSRLNSDLDNFYEELYEAYHTVTEEDYKVIGPRQQYDIEDKELKRLLLCFAEEKENGMLEDYTIE